MKECAGAKERYALKDITGPLLRDVYDSWVASAVRHVARTPGQLGPLSQHPVESAELLAPALPEPNRSGRVFKYRQTKGKHGRKEALGSAFAAASGAAVRGRKLSWQR